MAHLILNVGYDHDLILVRDCLTLFSKVITVLYLSMFGFPHLYNQYTKASQFSRGNATFPDITYLSSTELERF